MTCLRFEKCVVTGMAAGALSVGFYYAYRKWYSNRCDDVSTECRFEDVCEEDAFLGPCESNYSCEKVAAYEPKKVLAVLELPLNLKSLANKDQQIVLRLKAADDEDEECVTRLASNLPLADATGERYFGDFREQTDALSSRRSRCSNVQNSESRFTYIQAPDYEAATNGMFECESMRRLDGAINEVNVMLRRLGTMLERTKSDFGSRRTSIATRETVETRRQCQ